MRTTEKSNISIEDVKNEIKLNIGNIIRIRESNRQGKQLKEYVGTILSAHDSLFIIRFQVRNNYLNKSFSYVDFLTNEMTYAIIE